MQLRRWGVLLLGLALALGSTHVASAQVTTTGSIEVVLEDPQGGRLPGVSVTASANDVVTTRTAVTDAQGIATLQTLAPSAAYTVKATLPGFRDFEQTKILVRSGETTSIHAQLGLATVTEQVEVTVASPVVDVKRSISGADLTLQLTESLPTGRSYQSYLQLVPGVLPDSGLSTGNPASRSAMNWKDVITNDNLGISQENAYYFEGVNVTDPVTGTFGANLNTEIIQEQKVITGGIPAEYVGAGSLISTIITKSGSNTFHGSGTEFYQSDKLQAKNKHFASTKFNQYDTAFTIGGPVWKNKLWGFGSFRYLPRTEDVSAQDTLLLLRQVKTTGKQGFAKGTWAATKDDMISVMFLNDPQTRSGDTDPTVPNNRIRQRDQGGNNVSATYNRVAGSRLLLQGAFNYHNAAISDFAVDRTTRNSISYQTTDVRTLAQEQLGGFGQDAPETRPTKAGSFSAEYQWGAHRLKGGMEFVQHEDHRNLIYTGDGGQYVSLPGQYLAAGVTADSISNGPWSNRQFRTGTASDFNGLIAAINSLPNKAQFYQAYDTNKDGVITSSEFGAAAVFNSTAGNPTPGDVNYYRIFESAQGPQDLNQRGLSWYGQDEFTMNRFTMNVGLRSERWTHYDTNGTKTFAYPWTWAPRLSVAYDVNGDGRQKVSAYYGKYYEPVRMDMTQFTGTATGATRQEQIYIQNQWVTYRTRGGPTTIDGFFSPGAKTPYTAEFQLQHEIDLGNQLSVSSTYYYRAVRDVFEDFDPALYTVASAYPGSTTDPTLFLGWNYFGWSDAVHPGQGLPNANFFLGTLPDSKRNYHGLEFVGRKRFSDSWQMLTSYNYLHAMGNAVSVGNADFAGDVLWLDPRAPNLYGVVPGTVHHLFKTGATYTTKFGLEVGGSYGWNSGSIVNKTFLASSRRLPIEGDNTAAFGISSADVAAFGGWVVPGAVGATQNPSWGKIDARVSYTRKFGPTTTAFFFDVFDLTNGQPATRLEDLAAGTGTTKYGDQIAWRQPRRASLGARISF